jgi:head-tail adaptor
MRVGRLNKWVTLSRSPQETNDSDGFFEALDPEGVWAAIQPQGATGDGRTVSHFVTIRYHEQVDMDTRIVYGTRELFVRGFQNVDEQNVEMRLVCEEVVP